VTLCATSPGPASATAREPGRALLWLVVLSVTFTASYGFANWAAAQRTHVPSVVFAWEHRIPFLPWTIIPYWSIDLFYALALFLCADRRELQTHVRRVLTAQAVAVACFLAFPLHLAVAKPATDGIPGLLFDSLAGFDRPYNQAPSLHIALLVILWSFYARHVPRRWHAFLHTWAFLIGASVLTTYQHHFIDVPTGALLGLFCLWTWPDESESPLRAAARTRDPKRRRLAALYAAGALICTAAAILVGGWALWLLWPAVSLIMVAANYGMLGAAGFQKRSDGRIPIATRFLLAPYVIGAAINARLWTRGDAMTEIADDVWLGRLPLVARETTPRFATIIDLCAELPAARHGGRHIALPALDLIPLSQPDLRCAADAIETARRDGPVLVACALGYGRSAAAVAAWLALTGRAASAEAAIAWARKARPRIALA